MSNTTRPGGLYYVNGQAVDCDGNPIADAPPLGPDSPPVVPYQSTGKPLGVEIAEGIAAALKASAVVPAETPAPVVDPDPKAKK